MTIFGEQKLEDIGKVANKEIVGCKSNFKDSEVCVCEAKLVTGRGHSAH